jgi:hypothetical protein
MWEKDLKIFLSSGTLGLYYDKQVDPKAFWNWFTKYLTGKDWHIVKFYLYGTDSYTLCLNINIKIYFLGWK